MSNDKPSKCDTLKMFMVVANPLFGFLNQPQADQSKAPEATGQSICFSGGGGQ